MNFNLKNSPPTLGVVPEGSRENAVSPKPSPLSQSVDESAMMNKSMDSFATPENSHSPRYNARSASDGNVKSFENSARSMASSMSAALLSQVLSTQANEGKMAASVLMGKDAAVERQKSGGSALSRANSTDI